MANSLLLRSVSHPAGRLANRNRRYDRQAVAGVCGLVELGEQKKRADFLTFHQG